MTRESRLRVEGMIMILGLLAASILSFIFEKNVPAIIFGIIALLCFFLLLADHFVRRGW